jgi:hypothetical protein
MLYNVCELGSKEESAFCKTSDSKLEGENFQEA